MLLPPHLPLDPLRNHTRPPFLPRPILSLLLISPFSASLPSVEAILLCRSIALSHHLLLLFSTSSSSSYSYPPSPPVLSPTLRHYSLLPPLLSLLLPARSLVSLFVTHLYGHRPLSLSLHLHSFISPFSLFFRQKIILLVGGSTRLAGGRLAAEFSWNFVDVDPLLTRPVPAANMPRPGLWSGEELGNKRGEMRLQWRIWLRQHSLERRPR